LLYIRKRKKETLLLVAKSLLIESFEMNKHTVCLRGARNWRRGVGAAALPTELNVARQEVIRRRGDIISARNTVRAESVDNELNLAERTTGGDIRLAHVAQLARTRTVDGRGVAAALTNERARVRLTGPVRRAEGRRRLIQTVNAARVGEGGNGDKVTRIGRNLLEV
jgi:hypothetical protein